MLNVENKLLHRYTQVDVDLGVDNISTRTSSQFFSVYQKTLRQCNHSVVCWMFRVSCFVVEGLQSCKGTRSCEVHANFDRHAKLGYAPMRTVSIFFHFECLGKNITLL